MKEKFRVVAIDETANWDESLLAEYHIAKAFGLYLIREGEATHCCSVTPSSWAVAISNEFIFDFDLDPSLRPATIDEIPSRKGGCGSFWYSDDPLELVRRMPGDNGMCDEGLDDCYLDFIRISEHDSRFLSESITFKVRAKDYKGGSKGEAYHKAVWDEAEEYCRGNAMHPAILDPQVYLAYEADKRAKRRAENDPPLAQGRDQLPLFVAAAMRLPEAVVVAARGWVSAYVRHWYERHPEDLAEADKAKGLA